MCNEVIVSVIMPVYNASEFIEEAISSILNQTLRSLELIIVDDKSTDDSLQKIKSFNDPRIILIENNINSGIVVSLNIGIRQSSGKYIARMDADDISEINRLELQVDYLELNESIGVCGSYANFFGQNNGTWKTPTHHEDIVSGLLNGSTFCHPSVVMRASILKNNDIKYSEEFIYAEDYLLWIKLSDVTKFYNLPFALINYRTSKNQTSQKQEIKQKESHCLCQIYFISKYLGISPSEIEFLTKGLKNFNEVKDLIKLFSSRKLNKEDNLYKISFDYNASIYILNKVSESGFLDVKFILEFIKAGYFSRLNYRMKLGLIRKVVFNHVV